LRVFHADDVFRDVSCCDSTWWAHH
jgi:hypothetical protein